MISAQEWLRRLGGLNVSRSKAKGLAPNKPLLVLALIDMFEAGLVPANGEVLKGAELQLRFRTYSPICVRRRGNRIDLDLPWKHLASDGLYQHVDESKGLIQLSPGLMRVLMDPALRKQARVILVTTYFPPDEQVELFAALGMGSPSSQEIAQVKEDAAKYQTLVRRGRDARFRVNVISGYRFTCALTGYRLEATGGFNLLQAAHIQAHASKGPDVATNGLALTPTAHELFDAGLWTINDDLTIRVRKSDFAETRLPSSPHFLLSDLDGRRLCFDPASSLRPDPVYLAWHRSNVSKGRITET